MAIETNYLKVKQWKNKRWLIVQTETLGACLEFIQSPAYSTFEGLIISRDLGYVAQDVSFLKTIPFVRSLTISDNIKDISGIYSLRDLNILNLADNEEYVDLSRLPALVELSFDWTVKITNLAQCHNLQKLIIGGFRPKTKSMAELPPLPSLKEIRIVKSNVPDLRGFEKFSGLKHVELCYFNRLENIDHFGCQQIETLVFSDCPRIKKQDIVKRLKHLQVLKFNNCGTISSIKFITELTKLKTFTFVDTAVEDGDMNPCFNLEWVGFSDLAHYSHTLKEIRIGIGDRKRAK